jgi:peptidoglycan hydrolase CwlO-like protein
MMSPCFEHIAVKSEHVEDFMNIKMTLAALVSFVSSVLGSTEVNAQDVPGIEICTVEKTWERRTSCLQSNVDFLQKTITKLVTDHQQKVDAANRQIESLKSASATLQKRVDDLLAAQKKMEEDLKKKADTPPAKDAAPAAKEGSK